MANPFVHVELATTDLDKAKSFYRSLFDWKLNEMDMGGGHSYTMIEVGEGTGGGMMKHPMPGEPSIWLAYVNVDDLASATEKAKSLGASWCELRNDVRLFRADRVVSADVRNRPATALCRLPRKPS